MNLIRKKYLIVFLDKGSPLFINLMGLKVCNILEIQGSYQSINDHFSKIVTFLNTSDTKGDKKYKSAFRIFSFFHLVSLFDGKTEYAAERS